MRDPYLILGRADWQSSRYDETVAELETARGALGKERERVETQEAVSNRQEKVIKALEGQERIAKELGEKLKYLTKLLEQSNRDNKLKLQGLELRKMAEKIGVEKEVIYKKIIERKDAVITGLERKLACYRAPDGFQLIPVSEVSTPGPQQMSPSPSRGITRKFGDNDEFSVKRTFDDYGDDVGYFDPKRRKQE